MGKATLVLSVVLAVTCLGSTAWSQQRNDPYDSGDMALTAGASVLGGVAGGAALGFGAALATDDHGFASLGNFILGFGVGSTLGAGFAAWGVGEALDGDGSLGWSLGGSALGLVAAVAALPYAPEGGSAVVLLALPGVFSSTAYILSHSPPAGGSALRISPLYDPSTGLRGLSVAGSLDAL